MCCIGAVCTLVRWFSVAVVFAFVFVTAGYVGKYAYLVAHRGDPTIWQLLEMRFWRPDATFWLAGTLAVAVLVGTLLLLYVAFAGLRRALCRCVFSSDDAAVDDDVVELAPLDKSARRSGRVTVTGYEMPARRLAYVDFT